LFQARVKRSRLVFIVSAPGRILVEKKVLELVVVELPKLQKHQEHLVNGLDINVIGLYGQ
jgi:hypothetical protein